MSTKTCYATADTPRAAVALLFPFAAVAAGLAIMNAKGYAPLDYFMLLQSGELSWARQGIAWIALAVWIARYFPAAFSALVDGPCLVTADDDTIVLPGTKRIRRDEIRAVRLHRGLFRKVAYLETAKGGVALPLIFVRRSSDERLASIVRVD